VAVPWLALPTAASPRWLLRAAPPAMALAGLRVYHPVTWKGFVGWQAARLVAASGALRVVPARGTAPPEVLDVLHDYVSEGRVLGIARLRAGRFIVLGIDESRQRFVAKVAVDPAGRARLRLEADAVRRVAGVIPSPLCVPRMIAAGEGFLLFEEVAWMARARSWHLPVEVAYALGRLFRMGPSVQHPDRGLSHGDFAPWNLMRTAEGWTLIDWGRSSESSPAFFDPLHFLVQAHTHLGRPTRSALLRGLGGEGHTGRVLHAYAAGAGLRTTRMRERLAGYLEATADRVEVGTRQGQIERQARDRLRAILSS
jgi:hypothetical protein